MTLRDSLLAVLVALVWGVNFVVIDWGMHGVPPLLFLAIRFVLVAFPAVLIVRRPDAPWRTIVAVGTLLSLGQFGFLYTSIAAGLPPGLAALVLQAQVLFTIAIAAGVLTDMPTGWQLVGVLLGSLGLVVVGLGRGGGTPLPAMLLCLCAALSWAAGNVVVRACGVRGGLGLTVWSAIVVPVPALLVSLLVDGPAAVFAALGQLGPRALVSTLYTVVLASLLGFGLFTRLLGSYPAAVVVPWVLLVPPIAMLAAWLARGDVPATGEAVGGAIMLFGVLLAVVPWGARRPLRLPVHRGGRAGRSLEFGRMTAVGDRGGTVRGGNPGRPGGPGCPSGPSAACRRNPSSSTASG